MGPVATHRRDRLDIGNAMLRFNTTGITRFADPLLCLEKTNKSGRDVFIAEIFFFGGGVHSQTRKNVRSIYLHLVNVL